MSSGANEPSALAGFEPLLAAPARLQIVAVLANVSEADFGRLRVVTGASDSVLSKHCTALADAGLIVIRKAAFNGRQRTWASLTHAGRKVFAAHVAALERIVARSLTSTKSAKSA